MIDKNGWYIGSIWDLARELLSDEDYDLTVERYWEMEKEFNGQQDNKR